MSIAFDTLAYSKRAQAVGFKQEHADFMAQELATLITGELVTKDYLDSKLDKLFIRIGILVGSMSALIISVTGLLIKFHS